MDTVNGTDQASFLLTNERCRWEDDKVKKRSKNLGDAEIKQIVEVLDGCSGKLSWELLIDAIELRMYNRYTRQTLHKQEHIRHAFDLRKENLSQGERDTFRVLLPQLQIG